MKTFNTFGAIGQVLVAIAMLVLCFSFLISWTGVWPGYGWGPVAWPLFGLPFMGLMALGMLVFWGFGRRGMMSPLHSFRCGFGRHWQSQQEESFLDILQKRLARGEINREQFEELKRDLNRRFID